MTAPGHQGRPLLIIVWHDQFEIYDGMFDGSTTAKLSTHHIMQQHSHDVISGTRHPEFY
jgi:hypothetical protein